MESIEYTFQDKSSYPRRGPWDNEPDKAQWPDPATGLPCLAVRYPGRGYWCGYVGVAEGHPYFRDRVENLPGHGEVNYYRFCVEDDKEHGVCHIPSDGEPDRVWWFGFDCGHSYDVCPGESRPFFDGESEYRTLDYVKEQCAELAEALQKASITGGR